MKPTPTFATRGKACHRFPQRCRAILLFWSNLVVPFIGFSNSIADNFTWKNVAVGGGGYITGIVIHSKNPDIIYARTDVGGAYRWNEENQNWIPITDWIPFENVNLYGIESIALDPSDENIVYIACGKNLSGSPKGIYKSTDRGETWLGPYLSNVAMAANDVLPTGIAYPPVRSAGERLAVDPHAGNILYFGSRADGLWKSEDAGLTWNKVAIPSEGTPGYGISFVAVDPTSGNDTTPSNRVYIGVFDTSQVDSEGGVYRSNDSGETWSRLSDPEEVNVKQPRRGLCSPVDGRLWVTHSTGVVLAISSTNELSNITPTQSPNATYTALALDPTDASIAVVIEGNLRSKNAIYRTSNEGLSWSRVGESHQSVVPWWYDKMWAAAPSAALIRASDPVEFWYSDWYGIWRTENYQTNPLWSNLEDGHEELHVFSLLSLPSPSAAELFTACADVEGFRHDNGTDRFPSYSFGVSPGNGPDTDYQSTFGIDYCGDDPNHLVRSSGSFTPLSGGVCKSSDNGQSWEFCTGWDPQWFPRNVAISTADPDIFVVTVAGGVPRLTKDGGKTFVLCTTIKETTSENFWSISQPLAADRVESSKFYYYRSGKLYATAGDDLEFELLNDALPTSEQSTLRAMPNASNDLWLGLESGGLWRSTNGGSSFEEITSPNGESISTTSFCFGKPASGETPWLYLLGLIDEQHGVFLSKDLGETWERINPNVGCSPSVLQASWQVVGKVYVGTRGRGIFQGMGQPPAAPTNVAATMEGNSVSLSWAPSTGTTNYVVKRAFAEEGPYTSLQSVTSTAFVDPESTPGANYYTVSAVNDYGESISSLPVLIVTPPLVPEQLNSTAKNRRVNLSWEASSGASGYNVKRTESEYGPFAIYANVSSPAFEDLSVTNGLTYYYVVSATNPAGESPDSVSTSATPMISYSDFQKEYFGDSEDPDMISPDADPNGDGVKNIVAYAFNASPLTSAVDALPKGQHKGGYMILTFTRRHTTDLTYIVQKSTNLTHWTICDDHDAYSIEPLAPDLERVTVRSPTEDSKGFLRVKVSH